MNKFNSFYRLVCPICKINNVTPGHLFCDECLLSESRLNHFAKSEKKVFSKNRINGRVKKIKKQDMRDIESITRRIKANFKKERLKSNY